MSTTNVSVHVKTDDEFELRTIEVSPGDDRHAVTVGGDTIYFGRNAEGIRRLYDLLSALENYLHDVRYDDLRDSADFLGNLPHEAEIVR